jgi:tRNA modification GTPase
MRLAEPGEFTRRALLNGKLDLAQAEGLADLLAAETAAQVRQAMQLVDGRLSAQASAWRRGLIRALALLEASIDFADEDLPPSAAVEVGEILSALIVDFDRTLAGGAAAERLRVGFEVALVGAPNVGKSTLLNTLAGREAAITSEIAGTTRDVIEVRMDLGGLPVTFIDMAGLHDASDPIERIGVAMATRRAALADLRVFLVDTTADTQYLGVSVTKDDQIVLSKADLRGDLPAAAISGATGDGVPELLARIGLVLQERVATAGLVGHERQRSAVARARTATDAARRLAPTAAGSPELAVAELQSAGRAIDFLLGKVDVEQVFDEIFARFCIGK